MNDAALIRGALPEPPPEGWEKLKSAQWVKDRWQQAADLHAALDRLVGEVWPLSEDYWDTRERMRDVMPDESPIDLEQHADAIATDVTRMRMRCR